MVWGGLKLEKSERQRLKVGGDRDRCSADVADLLECGPNSGRMRINSMQANADMIWEMG